MVQDRIVGWEEYDEFLSFLDRLGISYVQLKQEWVISGFCDEQRRDLRKQGLEPARLRRAAFVHPITGRRIILEEYVRRVTTESDWSKTWTVELVRYRTGERPNLKSWEENIFWDDEIAS